MRPLIDYRTSKLKEQLEKLKDLKASVPFKSQGICAYSSVFLVADLSQHWPKHSGNELFPVPHPEATPVYAYSHYPKWDKDTEYGRNRYELLEFLIEQLEFELTFRVFKWYDPRTWV